MERYLVNLTMGGWVILAIAAAVALSFVARLVRRDNDAMAWVLGALVVLVLRLVMPW